MPRPKKYRDNAEKQQAWRTRHAHKKPATIHELATHAQELCQAVRLSAMAGNPKALKITDSSDLVILRRLKADYSIDPAE
jgi:2-C-methyl-D-erythritol 4-phosphate cytidylyltransferase